MEFWVLTPFLGDDAESQRTINPWGLVELPRRQVFVGAVSAVVMALVVVAPLGFIAPYNWVVGACGVAASVWVFTSRTQALGVHQYRHMLDLAKARTNQPVYAGGKADTRVDDVRFLQQSWKLPDQRVHVAEQAEQHLDDIVGWGSPKPAPRTVTAPAKQLDTTKLRALELDDMLV